MGNPKRKSNPQIEERVQEIMGMMRDLTFKSGQTAKDLSAKWGISMTRVSQMTAEASRRVRAEIANPEETTLTVCAHLKTALEHAHKVRDYRQTAQLAKTWAEIVGAMAPKKSEVTQKQDLPDDPKELIKLIREEAQKQGLDLETELEEPEVH